VEQRAGADGSSEWVVTPTVTQYEFRTARTVPKMGCAPPPWRPEQCRRRRFNPAQLTGLLARLMLVGWGGNNGSTVTAGVLANRRCAQPVGRSQRGVPAHAPAQRLDLGDEGGGETGKLLGLADAGEHLPAGGHGGG